MYEPADAHVAPARAVRLPVGELRAKTDGGLVATLFPRQSGYDDAELESILHRLRALPPEFLSPDTIERQPGHWQVTFATERPRTVPLNQALRAWRRNLAVNVPLILCLARLLLRCDRALRELALPALPFASVLVRYTPQVPNPFRLAVLPAGRLRVAEWALADMESWLWAAPELALAGASGRGSRLAEEDSTISYTVGAALLECLGGALLPEVLTSGERFARWLRGQVGNPSTLAHALSGALPVSMSSELESLSQFIAHLVETDSRKRPSRDELESRVRQLSDDLNAHRLAARWEYEGRRDTALDVLNLYTDWSDPADVPWTSLASLREDNGDYDGAMVAALQAFKHRDSDAARFYTKFLHRLSTNVRFIEVLRDAMAHLEETSFRIGEGGRLLIAHIEAWRLGDMAAGLRHLDEPCRDPWYEAMRLLLRARLLIERDQYEAVSGLCKQGERLIRTMPRQGEKSGLYMCSYLALLDAIANYAAVGKYQDPSFFSDAFQRLTIALDAALEAEAEDLEEYCLSWLGFISTIALPLLPELEAGTQAYLFLRGLRLPPIVEPPNIPLYDELRLFEHEQLIVSPLI